MSNEHAPPHNISGLVAYRAELAGTILQYEERLSECFEHVQTINAAIKLIDPNYDLDSIKPRRQRARRHAVGATIFVLDTLRRSGNPQTARDLGVKLAEAREQSIDDAAALEKTVTQVQAALQSLRKQGTVEALKEGIGAQVWRLAD